MLKDLEFRTLRDISNVSDETLLSYREFNKYSLRAIRGFINRTKIPLDNERIEKDERFRAYNRYML